MWQLKRSMGILGVFFCMVASVHADAPNLLNYQGRLAGSGGSPQNGTFTMVFKVYDAVTGGSQLPTGSPWTETQSVTVTDGSFNVLLGSVTALPANLFDGGPSDAAGPLRFLDVTVSGEALAPRKRIVSAAYSIRSGSGSGLNCTVRNTRCGDPANGRPCNNGACTVYASCQPNEVLTGGGCSGGNTNSPIGDSYPGGTLGGAWYCFIPSCPTVGYIYAYAVCCQ